MRAWTMRTSVTLVRKTDRTRVVALSILLAASLMSVARVNATEDAQHESDDAAIRRVVAGFSDGWNLHDARAMCESVAEDVQWVGWRGDVSQSRKEVEDN